MAVWMAHQVAAVVVAGTEFASLPAEHWEVGTEIGDGHRIERTSPAIGHAARCGR